MAAQRGNHRGDVDGVRAWRDGDAVGSIHWPSSLRVGDLIVHDRAAVADEHWVVDLDGLVAGPVDDSTCGPTARHTRRGSPARARRRGERRWRAVSRSAATTTPPPGRPGLPRRVVARRRVGASGVVETSDQAQPARARVRRSATAARWAAGAAALASLATARRSAVPRSPALIATITVGLVLGVVVSTWLGRTVGSTAGGAPGCDRADDRRRLGTDRSRRSGPRRPAGRPARPDARTC